MHVLMASAEMSPAARVGGMAEAVAGLVNRLRFDGHDVTVALPDYGDVELVGECRDELDVPDWAGPASARSGILDGHGPLTLIDAPGIAKPDPYNDESGRAFPDNDHRFFAFSAGVAALVRRRRPDVLHLNDWHTAATLGLLTDDEAPPAVLTVHTLAYQGTCGPWWMERLVRAADHFAWFGGTNPLLGGIRLADRVVAVSPNYAAEILTEEHGMGLHHVLARLGDRLVGIVNGIDTDEWNPATDPHLVATYSAANLRGRGADRAALLERFGLDTDGRDQPVIGVVSRLVEQKGIDILAEAVRFLDGLPARLVVLGSGEAHLASWLTHLAETNPGRVGFVDGYDAALSHQVFAGSDLLAMPSRFEPCGLAQMQAMAYGAIPVVTDAGGLRDTVVDADLDPDAGTGFVCRSVDTAGLIDALHRACRAWSATRRRSAIRRRGMETDWSWSGPARRYVEQYEAITGGEGRPLPYSTTPPLGTTTTPASLTV